MAKNLSEMTKVEVLRLLAQSVLAKIKQLELDRQNTASEMSENNLAHYMQSQDRAIQNWRQLLGVLKTCQNHKFSRVEDGSLVKIAGYPSSEWVFIYKFRSSLSINGSTIEIDDGRLGRTKGSIHGARPGDRITLEGDERGISNIDVQILEVS